MTTVEALTKLLEAKLASLSDKEIVLLKADEIGIAAFPECHEFMADANFRGDRPEFDHAIAQYWNQFGRWKVVTVCGSDGEGASNLPEDLVTEYASKARASMIANSRCTVDEIIDFWNEAHEQA